MQAFSTQKKKKKAEAIAEINMQDHDFVTLKL